MMTQCAPDPVLCRGTGVDHAENEPGESARLCLLAFQRHYEAIRQAFEWRFTRADLTKLPARPVRSSQFSPHFTGRLTSGSNH